jgi:hypothetical protein
MEDPGLRWREVAPGLEDVFIHLMRDTDKQEELTP